MLLTPEFNVMQFIAWIHIPYDPAVQQQKQYEDISWIYISEQQWTWIFSPHVIAKSYMK
jgi:hypothetical protein